MFMSGPSRENGYLRFSGIKTIAEVAAWRIGPEALKPYGQKKPNKTNDLQRKKKTGTMLSGKLALWLCLLT